MKKIRYLLIVLLFLPCLAFAQSIQGTWKLVSFSITVDGQLNSEYFGKEPSGYIIFTPTRIMSILAKEGRKPGRTDAEKAALFDSVLSYTGVYRIEGNKIITDIDVSWNQAWTGTQNTRILSIEGNRLTSSTVPAPYSLDPTKTAVAKLVFERVE